MKTNVLNTEFNFAKSIKCNCIAAPNAYPSYIQGIKDFITPYLQELQNKTVIPDYLTLTSIQTFDHCDAGVHILTFSINQNKPNDFTLAYNEDDTAKTIVTEDLEQVFSYDPEACFGSKPQINAWDTCFTVIVPFDC